VRKKSLHRMLITRIVVVTAVVSAFVGAIFFHREQARVVATAHDQALIRTGSLAGLLRDHLDAPGLGDHAEIQRILNGLAEKRLELNTGYYVFAWILDPAGGEVARIEDGEHKNLPGILRHVGSGPPPPTGVKDAPEFLPVRIDGQRYVRARVPLANSRGTTAALVEAYFATRPEADRAARLDMLKSVALAMGIVFATSLLLYPSIVRLMRRLERLSLNLLDANLEMVGVVGSTIAKRDSDTDAHNFRVTIYSVRLAEALSLDDDMLRTLLKGAFLHDVGKIGIRDNILLKPGRLDGEEFEEMKRHVNHGLDIISKSAWLYEASAVVGSHHEKYDGNGYPAGLQGGAIPVLARIFAIADVFDALTSHRPYKKPLSYEETIDILVKGRGSHFDPEILDEFVRISRTLHDQYGQADDDRARRDLAGVVQRYFRADVATFLD
jgi:HD-GYP domain-containing protein (c-di-GMP phosphodiesterase class II)